MAPQEIRVDPVTLHHGSKQVLSAFEEAAVEFLDHDNNLAEATPGWIGASQRALNEVSTRWWIRHRDHLWSGTELGMGMGAAVAGYLDNEDASVQAMTSVVRAPGA